MPPLTILADEPPPSKTENVAFSKKTQYMIFTRSRSKTINLGTFCPKINNIPIEHKEVARFLGVLVDNKLTWTHHINAIKAKMSRYIGTMYKLKSILPVKARLMIYNSLIQSHLNYCSMLWGTSSKSNIEKLFRVQKKAIRATMPGFINYFYKDGNTPTHTKPFFKENNILTVHNIIVKHIVNFLNTLYHNPEHLPNSIIELIPDNAPDLTRSIEQSMSWYNEYNSVPYKNTVFFKGPLLYVELAQNSGYSTDFNVRGKLSFKKRSKSLILSIQHSGNEQEWENENFKLYCLPGIRRSERILLQRELG